MIQLYIHPPFQTICCIKTNCTDLAEKLQRMFGKYISCTTNRSVDFEIKIFRNNKAYELHFDTSLFLTDDPLQEIDRILFKCTKYHETVFALHGAAVEWSGKAYLFLAPTMSGKSTLTSYLASRGFGYITDDCILLDRTTFYVHPYTKPIFLRKRGFEVLQKYKAVPQGTHMIIDRTVSRYIYTPLNSITEPLPLGKVYFIFRSDFENKLFDMNMVERITAFMKAPITEYEINGDYLRFLAHLAKRTCQGLIFHDLSYVGEMIQHSH